MIIAQITDLHLGFSGLDKPCQNTKRLRHVISELNSLIAGPDIVLVTGDLVEGGQDWAYQKLKQELQQLNAPYYLALGNHDNRGSFQQAFNDIEFTDGFLQYTIDHWPVRIVVLDSLNEGRHGGDFCQRRANWLNATLAEAPDRPTLIALHHPPIETGIAWMTASDDNPWVKRLSDVISAHDNIIQVICGHIHRTIFKPFAGTVVYVSQAVAPQVKLELAEIDPTKPDNRILLNDSIPAYSLHQWKNGALTTHHATAPGGRPIVRYDKKHASVIQTTMDITES